MVTTIVGVAVIGLFVFIGWSRGVLRVLSAFACLLVAALLSGPLSFLSGWAVRSSGYVPRTLVPLAAQAATALVLFLLLSLLAGFILRRREQHREWNDLPRRARWEKYCGAFAGGLWGLVFLLIIATGIQMIGAVDEIVAEPSTVDSKGARGASTAAAPTSDEVSALSRLKQDVVSSAFGPLVARVTPLDERVEGIFRDLMTVTSDPILFERFRSHPKIAPLTTDPRLVALAEDPEIQSLAQQQQYWELLDNARIASLLEDQDLVARLSSLDLAQVLHDVIQQPRALESP